MTVRSAKGLEADVVILVELDGLDALKKRSHWLSIATSRAVSHLIVLAPVAAFLPRQPALAASLVHPLIE